MNIRQFELERLQSLYENTVDINLTESGFHPYTLKELLSEEQLDYINSLVLGYGQTNGSIPLRETISKLYHNCTQDQVMVTNGTCEANFIACHTLLSAGDEVIMMVPNYMQIWGVVEEMGCTPKEFQLEYANSWAPNLQQLREQITNQTKMIAVCNPNNPTGYVLSLEEMKDIVDIAKKHNLWILSDEVYRGVELEDVECPSFYGMYDKVVVNGGLSKAYALPGLRLGWLAGPKAMIDDSWAYSDYTSITASVLSHEVANIALQPIKRKEILLRSKSMLLENLHAISEWCKDYKDIFEFIPPKAGGMLFVKYNLPINSTELSEWLRLEKSVLILPGDVYGMDHYFRIGIGERKEYLMQGMNILGRSIRERF